MTMLVRAVCGTGADADAALAKVSVSATRSPSGSGGRIATTMIAGIMSAANSSRQHWQRRLPSVGLRGGGGGSASIAALAPTKGASSGCCCCLSHCAKGTSSVARIARPAQGRGGTCDASRYSEAAQPY
jgi:hypothetical protein